MDYDSTLSRRFYMPPAKRRDMFKGLAVTPDPPFTLSYPCVFNEAASFDWNAHLDNQYAVWLRYNSLDKSRKDLYLNTTKEIVMKDTIQINNVTLTRKQIEDALTELNTPEAFKPYVINLSETLGESIYEIARKLKIEIAKDYTSPTYSQTKGLFLNNRRSVAGKRERIEWELHENTNGTYALNCKVVGDA